MLILTVIIRIVDVYADCTVCPIVKSMKDYDYVCRSV